MRGLPGAGEAILGRGLVSGRSFADHTALDKEVQCEEMAESLSHGSRQHSDI